MRPSESGAALLAVLALVALLGGFAAVGLTRLKGAVDAQVGNGARAEARLVARSALLVATLRADGGAVADAGETALAGGSAETRWRDGGNCLNLNGLGAPGGEGAKALERLLGAVGAGGGRTLADATVAWAGEVRRADVSEWAAMPGVSAETYERAAPLLCTLPDSEPAALNVNTLTAEQAPLLVAAGFAPAYARAAILNRPASGYRFIVDFWRAATPDGLQPLGRMANATGLTTRWHRVRIGARARGATATMEALLDGRAKPAAVVGVKWR